MMPLLIGFCQIVHWKNHLKFPEEARISPAAKDLISSLLCDVENRLGSDGGAEQIKVSFPNCTDF